MTQRDDAWLIDFKPKEIDFKPKEDESGLVFARMWYRQELAEQGLDTEIAHESLSFNQHRRAC
jgi:hypothetical protein